MKIAWGIDNQVSDLQKKVSKDVNSPSKENGRETLKGTLRGWASNSTTHGVSSLERSEHLARRLFWLCAVLVGIGWYILRSLKRRGFLIPCLIFMVNINIFQ